jgi:hypothetical protein
MQTPPTKLFEVAPSTFTIGAELANRLGDLIQSARADFNPRDFAERHLVDDLAISKWRALRVTLMEKAVFEHESVTFNPRALKDESGVLFEPHEDMYHLAMAHAPERHATVLAALGRLEIRYARQFATSLRLLIALRRGSPPPVPNASPNKAKPTAPKPRITNETRKETSPCELSANTQATM